VIPAGGPSGRCGTGSLLRRAAACIGAGIVAFVAAGPAAAQSWPEKPLKIVVAAPAGSSLDTLSRVIGDRLKPRLGQPVVVDNRPAASGTVATAEVARAAPDGHTLVMSYNGPLAFAPLLQKLPYDVTRDLVPVVLTSSQPNVLVVNAQLPVRGVQELVAWGKANPGKLSYASVGNGSSSHLTMELLKSLSGLDAVHVPFNGSPPAVTATVQGETQLMFAVMQPLAAQIQAGKLRAIAVTTARRFPPLPDLPTIAEAGYPGFEALAWNGLLVPAGTPAAVIARLNAEINAVLREPDVVARMRDAGFDLVGGSPEQFAQVIAGESARWGPVIRKIGLRLD
jgi:tripartite-type tricarboxylate transporter receptor subunit TctC